MEQKYDAWNKINSKVKKWWRRKKNIQNLSRSLEWPEKKYKGGRKSWGEIEGPGDSGEYYSRKLMANTLFINFDCGHMPSGRIGCDTLSGNIKNLIEIDCRKKWRTINQYRPLHRQQPLFSSIPWSKHQHGCAVHTKQSTQQETLLRYHLKRYSSVSFTLASNFCFFSSFPSFFFDKLLFVFVKSFEIYEERQFCVFHSKMYSRRESFDS